MTSFYQVNTTEIISKLKLKMKPAKIMWYITNIQKDQVNILSTHPTKNNHELAIISCSNTPEIFYILKQLNQPYSTIDKFTKKFIFIKPKLNCISRFSTQKNTDLDQNEDASDLSNIIIKKIAFSLGTRPAGPCDDQDAYDNRQRALYGSILRGPADKWYQVLAAGLPWNNIRDLFITRFTDDKYRRQIDTENIKIQPVELIKSYIHRLNFAVDCGWPNPFFNKDYQRTAKKVEFFVGCLNPPSPL